MNVAGLTATASSHGPKATMDRLVAAVTDHGMTVLARIDHAAAAAKVGLTLRPTEVLIFGSPKVGTALMQAGQTIGIDLPLKALVWEDEAAATWLAFDEPAWLAQRHRLDASLDPILHAMRDALVTVTAAATRRDPDGTS